MSLPNSSKLSSMHSAALVSAALVAIATSLTACTVTNDANKPVSSPTTTTAATATTPATTESLPLVVATNTVACDLVKQIAGDTVNLKCLIEAGSDPHGYQPKPEDRKNLDSAKLVIYGGYNFEPALVKLITASSNPAPKVAVNEVAVPTPLIAEDEHDHSHEKESKKAGQKAAVKEADPHVWNNAQNGIKIAQAINKSLSNLRPEQAEAYGKKTAKLVNELEQIDAWIKVQIATIPAGSRKLVTTHDALGYYANAYGIPVEGALTGLSTEEQPTPARIKQLVELIKASQVPTIFVELSSNPKLMQTVSKEANVKISEREIYADGLGAKGSEGETYVGMLIANTRTIVEGLGGKYTPFQLKN